MKVILQQENILTVIQMLERTFCLYKQLTASTEKHLIVKNIKNSKDVEQWKISERHSPECETDIV